MKLTSNGKRISSRTGNVAAGRKPLFRQIGMTFTSNGKTVKSLQVRPWKMLGLKRNAFYKLIKEYEGKS